MSDERVVSIRYEIPAEPDVNVVIDEQGNRWIRTLWIAAGEKNISDHYRWVRENTGISYGWAELLAHGWVEPEVVRAHFYVIWFPERNRWLWEKSWNKYARDPYTPNLGNAWAFWDRDTAHEKFGQLVIDGRVPNQPYKVHVVGRTIEHD